MLLHFPHELVDFPLHAAEYAMRCELLCLESMHFVELHAALQKLCGGRGDDLSVLGGKLILRPEDFLFDLALARFHEVVFLEEEVMQDQPEGPDIHL